MTLYFQILETTNVESKKYTVRRAWNFFGYIISIPTTERWLPSYNGTCSLYTLDQLSGTFNSLEDAHERINDHVTELKRREKILESTKTKIVETVKITDVN